MKKAYKIKIYGRVTGVGFRYFVLEKSENYPSLTGYVRNICSGEVEVFLQGEEDDIGAMIGWLYLGPSFAKVESIEKTEVNFDPSMSSFAIR